MCMTICSKWRGSRPDLKFAHAALLQKRGDPGSQNHVAANGEWCVHQEIEPVGVVGGFLQPKRHMHEPYPMLWMQYLVSRILCSAVQINMIKGYVNIIRAHATFDHVDLDVRVNTPISHFFLRLQKCQCRQTRCSCKWWRRHRKSQSRICFRRWRRKRRWETGRWPG